MQTRLLIDGKLTGGEGVAESILDPASGMQIAQVPEASRDQVDAAVGAAKAAFSGFHRPKMTIPNAINPWPETILSRKSPTWASTRYPPAIPAPAPEINVPT